MVNQEWLDEAKAPSGSRLSAPSLSAPSKPARVRSRHRKHPRAWMAIT
ncbi:hypothetical protein STRAU_2316 [Streptomyces aurantiacus JA 4570]|uniref:Uncharacterized protein n=1 Tax=Streptomyces aurantiacus JA 4570 TaxID=1286094 RepID=S3ZN69_9ACTN|nr:hypothetical protein STRAU_2316 [Streptomyces aurantiacus JA 4570]